VNSPADPVSQAESIAAFQDQLAKKLVIGEKSDDRESPNLFEQHPLIDRLYSAGPL
jgi:hypothetical protein